MSAVLPLPASVATKTVAGSARYPGDSGTFSLGKYREIIIAVGFFLLFDLGVLVLNFYTSFQIAQDAVGINLSGRQRMLSQRTAKAMLSVEAARLKGLPAGEELDELRSAARLFDTSLKGFQQGATVPGGDGKPVFLRAADSTKAIEVLRQAQAIWTPYQTRMAPVLGGASTDAELQLAGDYARANNLKLLGLMNELTTALEAVASERANTLRQVQTGGIVLALLNFAFILFKFLRRLRTSDAAVEAATEENREILINVREGLFLMTPAFTLGSQVSDSAHTLFGQPLAPGDSFFGLLAPLVSPKVLEDARDYVELLFSPHIKEALVQGINPLLEVEVAVKNRLGQATQRHLSFHFNRVNGNVNGGVNGGADGRASDTVRHLLVTVQDISQRVALEHKLKVERQRSQQEFAMLLKAFDTDPTTLRQFIARSEVSLLKINDLLRSTSTAPGESAMIKVIDQVFHRIHALKGDAAALGLETLAAQAHQFESDLQRTRQSGGTTGNMGDALLALPMPLEDLLGKIAALKSLLDIRRDGVAGVATDTLDNKPHPGLNNTLTQLTRSIAAESGKRVMAHVDMGHHHRLASPASDLVREIAVQLIRNAVAHGIEASIDRLGAGKALEGKIDVTLVREPAPSEGDGKDGACWCLSVRDDGAGLSAAKVRQTLLDKGWYTAVQLESFSDPQIVAHILKPGFSTAEGVTPHAGRGIGLDVVQANVQQLGGRLLLTSTFGRFTEFRVRFSA
jgi:two-component system chemotaxis sensor kinase CheA